MLNVTRKLNQTLTFQFEDSDGNLIEIKQHIKKIPNTNEVRIGIEAPPQVRISKDK